MDVLTHTMLGIDRILNGSSKGPQQPMPGIPALVEGPSPTADAGTAGVGTSARCKSCGASMYALYDSCTQCLTVQSAEYPVTCRARYYDAASRILEDEPRLFTHDNVDELGHVIQKWIEETRNNWEPRT
jgi:hypothetical protein